MSIPATGSIVTAMTWTETADMADPETRLAALLIEQGDVEADNDREQMDAAHAERMAALDRAAQKLDESADELEAGAWTSAALSVASGAATVSGGLREIDAADAQAQFGKSSPLVLKMRAQAQLMEGLGTTGQSLAEPVNVLVGQAPSKHAAADGARANKDAESAQSRVDDARSHREQVERQQDEVFSMLEQAQNNKNAAANKVIDDM